MPSSRSSSTSRPDVIGLIRWLPPRTELTEDLLARTDVPEGWYNHPVVILATDVAGAKVIALMITSFNGLHLKKKFPRKSASRLHYLPIYPSPPHPDVSICLQLDHSKSLRKNSYINTGRCCIIPLSALRAYDRTGTGYRLDMKARVTLISHLHSYESSEPSVARFLEFVARKKNQMMRTRLLSQVSTNESPRHIPIGPRRGNHNHRTSYNTLPTVVVEHQIAPPVSKMLNITELWSQPDILVILTELFEVPTRTAQTTQQRVDLYFWYDDKPYQWPLE